MRILKNSLHTVFFNAIAPLTVGAIFLLTACDQKQPRTVEKAWGKKPSAAVAESTQAAKKLTEPAFTFVAYNVKNWLEMRRYIDGERRVTNKPEKEIQPLIQLMVECAPNILGISEIGSEKDLSDLQSRLKTAGLDYPHSHYAHGVDDVRRLAILSQYPIIKTQDHSKLTHYIDDKAWGISRGILDATLETPIGEIRFLGAHLKSKRPIPDGDEALIRFGEAHLLRTVIEEVLETDPSTKLMVYGDINDTKRSDSVRAIIGRKNSKLGLWYVNAKDSHGTTWTHHWAREDIYSRIDWVFASNALWPYIDNANASIPDGTDVLIPSDHRPVIIPVLAKKRRLK